MKQGILVPIILLLLVSCVSALEVVILRAPADYTNLTSNSVIFKCQAGYDVDNITLRFQSSGVWYDIETKDASDFQDVEFLYTIPASGEYKWNCLATDTNNQQLSAPKEYTIFLLPQNTHPEISCTIPNQTKSFSDLESREWTIDLTGCKTDNEDSPLDLIWTVENIQSSFCNVEILSGNVIKFIPQSYGSHTVTFVLTDSGELTDTQDVKITINQGTSSCTDTIWSPPTSDYCDGEEFTQTSNCDNIRTATGTKSCSSGCTEDWYCDSWSDCDDGYETRDCTDDNDCGTEEDKPDEVKSCTSTSSSTSEFTIEITKAYPSFNNIKIKPGESKKFEITTNTNDIVWYVDNKKVKEDSKSFTYTSTETGEHIIKVIVGSSPDMDVKTWDIKIEGETISTNLCGNSKIDINETCLTCAKDVPCKEKEDCDEGICKEKQLNLITGFFIGTKDFVVQKWYYPTLLFSLILLLIIITKIMKMHKKPKGDDYLAEFKDEKTFLQRVRKKLRNWDKKRQLRKQNKETLKRLKLERRDNIRVTAPGIESIMTFINQRLGEGNSRKEVKKALKQKGWNRKQIKQAFKKLKNDSRKPTQGNQSLSK